MPRWSSFDVAADRRLVQRLNDGDEEALAALYDTYAERLYDYALSMTGEYKVAADIAHDTFIDAARRSPRMRDHVRLRSWLYGAVRRRCLQRARTRVLFWEPDVEFGDPELPPSPELRRLLDKSLSRLELGEQESLLLAVRHGLLPAEIGVVLGISSRRAAARVARSRGLLDEAYGTEVGLATERCVSVKRTTSVAPANAKPANTETAAKTGRVSPGVQAALKHCPECARRAKVNVARLLALAPSPALPSGLRHRVVHTATDPELAGYRTDIAARGGALTPDGLPTQPDMPSPFAKRWLFAGGIMAGALTTALLAALLMGPGVGNGTILWPPFHARPQPSITDQVPGHPHGRDEGQAGGEQGRSPSVDPGGRPPVRPNGQETSPPGTSTPEPEKPGTLTVTPSRVELYSSKTGKVRLAAARGPVSWQANSSSDQVTMSRQQGVLSEDASAEITLTLDTGLLNLPGQAVVTFTDPTTGTDHEVTVVWGLSLL